MERLGKMGSVDCRETVNPGLKINIRYVKEGSFSCCS